MPPEPDWYPDPSDPGLLRYWDGSSWTDHTAPSVAVADRAVRTDTRVPAAVILALGLLSLAMSWTLVLPIVTIYLNRRYDDELRLGESGSWMAMVGGWLAVLALVLGALFWLTLLASGDINRLS